MADRFNMSVADLFASLNLDASGLDKGLADSEVSLQEFQSKVKTIVSQVSTSFQNATPAVNALSAALNLMGTAADVGVDGIKNLGSATDQLIARQERLEAQSIRMKAEYKAAAIARAEADKIWQQGLHNAWEGKQNQTTGQYDVVDASIAKADNERNRIAARTAEQESRMQEIAEKRSFDAEFQVLLNEEKAQREQASALMAESNAEEKRISQQRSAIQAEDIASRREYVSLINQLTVEQEAADVKVATEMEAAFSVQMDMLNARLQARRSEIAEERYLAQQAMEARRSQAAAENAASAPVGGGGFASVGLRMGANGINPNIRIGQMLSQAVVGPLMNVIIPIAIIDAAINMVERYGGSVVDAASKMVGFGKANEDAWTKAYEGSLKATEGLSKYLEKINTANADIAKGENKDLLLAAGSKNIEAFLGKVSVGAKEQLDTARKVAMEMGATQAQLLPFGGIEDKNRTERYVGKGTSTTIPPLSTETRQAIAHGETLAISMDKLKAAYEHNVAISKEVEDERLKVLADNNKAIAANTKTHEKKGHDQVHEYSSRAPGFAGGGLAHDGIVISGSFGPPPNISTEVHTPIAQIQSQGSLTGNAPPPPMRMLQPRSSNVQPSIPSRATPSSPTGGSGTASVSITNHYTFHYSGVPDFMRDIIEPKMVSDLENNARGLAKQVTEALKKQGVVVR